MLMAISYPFNHLFKKYTQENNVIYAMRNICDSQLLLYFK
jgi:hypothetical protein